MKWPFGRKKHPSIDERTPFGNVRYVVVDTELTGLDEKKDSIVSLGAIRMNGAAIDLGNSFARLVSPRTALSATSVLIHEITPSDVEAKPVIDAVLKEFLDFCGTAVLVGHFIAIDLAFLNRELKRARGTGIQNPVLDTFSVYEWLRKRNKVGTCPATSSGLFRLYDIARCLDIPVNGSHDALMDAFSTAQLLQRFFPLLTEAGAVDIGDLLRIGTPFEGGDRFQLTNEFSNF